MYKIYMYKTVVENNVTRTDEYLVYNDVTPELSSTKLIDPKLILEDNAAGSFTCKIPQGNAIYNDIEPMVTTVRITRDDEWIWTGRILTIKKDFWLQQEITAEGALAFLNDVALTQQKWTSISTDDYVRSILSIYNSRVPTNRRINPGSISISTSAGAPIGLNDYISTGESPLKHISTLAEDWGLHMRIRETSSVLYLDLRTDGQLPTSNQQIDFGKNLIDYIDEMDWSDLITVIHPLGKELDTHTKTGDEEYPDKLTINSNPSSSLLRRDGEYLYNDSAVKKFGRIEETVEWSEVEDPQVLKSLAEMYLLDYQYYDIKLTVKVVDLHYLTNSTQGFQFLSKVYCKSKPHNLAKEFIISKMEIPFDKPDQTTFSFSRSTMGYYTSDRPTQGFGKGTVSGQNINVKTFSRSSVLNAAKEKAAQMILSNTHGYVSLNMDSNNDHVENITITNAATQDRSSQRWLWSAGGLMYQERDPNTSQWQQPNIAITMDGEIVANFITAGVLTVPYSDTEPIIKTNRDAGTYLFSVDMTHHKMNLGPFVVNGQCIYYDRRAMDDVCAGIYIGSDDGIALANNRNTIKIYDDKIDCLSVNTGGISGETLMARITMYDEMTIAATDDIVLRTNGTICVGGFSSSGTVDAGVTRSVTVDGVSLTFKKGICTEINDNSGIQPG